MNSFEEKWNNIVYLHKQYFRDPESKIQELWETIFSEILGYSKLKGEVEAHRNVFIGSSERVIPDIILKNGNEDLFTVELKQHNMVFTESMEKQLFSYLKLLLKNIGIIVCDKLYIYACDFSKKDNEQLKVEIPFEENNSDGVKFVEMFSKGNFSSEIIKKFVLDKNSFDLNIKTISNEITDSFLRKILKEYFLIKYSEEEIETALKDISITINKGSVPTQPIIDDGGNGDDPVPGDNGISKEKAIRIARDNGIKILNSHQCTFASLNKTGINYWANPPIKLLKQDWYLILNDVKNHNLYCFMIPKNTILEQQVAARKDQPNKIDLKIIYNDPLFADSRSGIKFLQWQIKRITY